MQQDKISIDLKPPTKWEDLSDKQLRYVFTLLAQGFTATEVKAYCLHRWAGLKVLHRYGNVWACKHDGLNFVLAAEQVERATHALDWLYSVPTDASSRCRSHKPSSKSAIERAQCQACLSIAEREQIMQYGLWQDYGTGRETPRKSSAESSTLELCRGAAGVALATPPWQQRRHRQSQSAATPQVVQPKVLRFGNAVERVL
jgi:hypothetical protein